MTAVMAIRRADQTFREYLSELRSSPPRIAPNDSLGDSRCAGARSGVASQLCATIEASRGSPSEAMISLIQERLEQDPQFHGRTSLLRVEQISGSIVVSGRLPTYYLKQLLQEVVRRIPGVEQIENRVEVLPGSTSPLQRLSNSAGGPAGTWYS